MTGRVPTRIFEDANVTIDEASGCAIPGYLIVRPCGEATSLAHLGADGAGALGVALSRATAAIERVTGADRVYVLVLAELDRRVHVHLFPRTGWLLHAYWRATGTQAEAINGARLFDWARATYADEPGLPPEAGTVAGASAALRATLADPLSGVPGLSAPVHADVDEPIVIVEYDPSWPASFEAEECRVREALGTAVTGVEHVGSTAVPGMPGKPVVDLLVGVRDLAGAAGALHALERLGYVNFGEVFIPGRIYLRRRGAAAYNIAVAVEGGEFWRTQLAVREYLRSHPGEAAAYADAKRTAFDDGARLFSSYSQKKAPYVERLIARALAWHAG